MKVKDFERAIDALSADITIDEMMLRHSDVRQVNAHTTNLLVVWDGNGRAFSARKRNEHEIYLTEGEDGKLTGVSGVPVERDKSFDLKFE